MRLNLGDAHIGQKHLKPGDAHVARLYKRNKFINTIKPWRRPYRSSLHLFWIRRRAYSTSLQNNKFTTTLNL